MNYTITNRGIEKSETGKFATWAEAKTIWDSLLTAPKPLTAEQHSNLINNIPNDPINAVKRMAEYEAQTRQDEGM